MPNYHDVTCSYADKQVKISEHYDLQLHCSRSRGWSLWHVWEDKETLLAEEYGDPKLHIEVNHIKIL